jgi:hypothetical protein
VHSTGMDSVGLVSSFQEDFEEKYLTDHEFHRFGLQTTVIR